MKKTILPIATIAVMFASCQDVPKADNVVATETQAKAETSGTTEYKADIAETKLEFVGTKPVGKHHGTIGLQNGSLAIDGDTIKGGTFVFDMNSLATDDQDSIGNAKLTGHLKTPDFFDVAQFGTATFEITKVMVGVDAATKEIVLQDATHTITGNLILKGVSKSISFPAKVNMNGDVITADANFNIDRTHWGLNYHSESSFQDKMINPLVNISLHLVSNKAAAVAL